MTGDGCGSGTSQSGDPFGVGGGSTGSVSGAVPAVPEPATLAILAAGLAGIGASRRRRAV